MGGGDIPITDPAILAGMAEPARAPHNAKTPSEWVKKNLFNSPVGSILTVVLGAIALYWAYRAFRFVFITGQWQAVKTNLTLFMVGTYPRVGDNNQLWRIAAQFVTLGLAGGLFVGASSAASHRSAEAAGLTIEPSTPLDLVKRFWSVLLFIAVCLSFVTTITPVLIILGSFAAGVAGFLIGKVMPGTYGFVLGALATIAVFQIVIGTSRKAWIPTALVLAYVVVQLVGQSGLAGQVEAGVKAAAAIATTVVVWLVYGLFDYQGVGWEQWGGFMLNLTLAATAILFAFPFGLLLALARRSQLPVIRWMATVYIELIRGVPLITLLFMGQFLLGFFINSSSLANTTRAIVAMTLFSAAYIAEIVRGGLLALPKGQIEAGQALGLAPTQTMRLIVLPQALRAVIPSMVGQFISLFKDTSLVFIVGLTEILGVRDIVHAQADFRAQGHAETLVFVAFAFWAFAFAMSRESQNLERKLGVGTR